MAVDPRAVPLANAALTITILDVVQGARNRQKLKRGTNESSVRAVHKKSSEMVVMAADADNIGVVLPLAWLAEDMNVPYVFVPSKVDLANACGIRNVVGCCACSISKDKRRGKEFDDQIRALKDAVRNIVI